jgi:hypothetical protein
MSKHRNSTQSLVDHVLRHIPETRKNDRILFWVCLYLRKTGSFSGALSEDIPLQITLEDLRRMPSIATIARSKARAIAPSIIRKVELEIKKPEVYTEKKAGFFNWLFKRS